jgi:hypothetical protein
MIILPIFDSAKHIEDQINFSYLSEEYNIKDLEIIHKYLNLCSSTRAFNQYRKIETLFHWCTLIAKISLIDLTPMDLNF